MRNHRNSVEEVLARSAAAALKDYLRARGDAGGTLKEASKATGYAWSTIWQSARAMRLAGLALQKGGGASSRWYWVGVRHV